MKKKILLLPVLLAALVLLVIYQIAMQKKSFVPEKPLFTVGTSADFPPFEYIEQGAIKGFDIDLVEEIAKRMDKQLMITDMPFFTLIPELDFGDVDMIIGGITATPERAKKVLFTQPYLQDVSLVVITVAPNKVTSLDDLTGKIVIVNDGYTADLYMSERNDVILEKIPTVVDAFMALEKGQAFAFVSAENTVGGFFEKYGKDRFNIYRIPDTNENSSMAVAKNNPALLEEINQILHTLQQDGTLTTLKQKWNLA